MTRVPPLRLAMVGGGPGSFIGPVHRMAAELDGAFELVAGAFSRDRQRSIAAADRYGVATDRAYADYRQMIAAEHDRPDGAEVVAVVTPNHLHFPVAQAALAAGIHVISDKPATATLAEALALQVMIDRAGVRYGLSYTYTGYPMVREARELCCGGELGAIRKVVVEYSQGWLSHAIERAGDRQAAWRADPEQAGVGGCIGDIGVHAFNIAEFVSGRQVAELCADLSSVVPGRALDDDCNMLLRFDNGAPGVLIASQIAAGDRNGLRLRVYGERGNLDWSHENPQILTVNWADRPTEILHAGAPYLRRGATRDSRLPSGHPEGFIEAFANIYRDFADDIRAGGDRGESLVPGIEAGIRGVAFVECAVAASRARAGWVKLDWSGA
ncbi:MAG: Gfo/Idh/MocA family oxidoreductase [Caulobacteraceae bacterium]|nr:Gfo/Idh/MocA family oxidoreductase [Caulobacteraceae bacterium]